MKTRTRQAAHQMVRWVFQQGNNLVICAVHREAEGSSYAVSVACNGPTGAIVERCDSGVIALQRHADIAAALRDRGWTLLAYTNDRTTRAAQPRVARSHAA